LRHGVDKILSIQALKWGTEIKTEFEVRLDPHSSLPNARTPI